MGNWLYFQVNNTQPIDLNIILVVIWFSHQQIKCLILKLEPNLNPVFDGGVLYDKPSTVIRADDYGIEVVREGLGEVDFLGR